MKKYIAALLAFCMLWQVSLAAMNKTGVLVDNPKVTKPSAVVPKMTDGTVVLEAEQGVVNEKAATVVSDASASGGEAVKTTAGLSLNSVPTGDATLTLPYTVGWEGTYHIWMRTIATNDTNNSWYVDYGSGGYTQLYFGNYKSGYQWIKLSDLYIAEAGETYIAFKYRKNNCLMDKIVITADNDYAPVNMNDMPQAVSASVDLNTLYPAPLISPEVGKHPRLYVDDTTIERIKKNTQSELFAPAYEAVKRFAADEIDMNGLDGSNGGYVGTAKLNKIRARALLYLIGEVDDAHAKQTIAYMREFLENVKYNPSYQDITRSMGDALVAGAEVYDWCYHLMTEEDKESFVKHFKRIAGQKEVGYPPTKQNDIGGHGGEGEIMRDLLAAGIACYDEYPDMYNMTAGRFFDRFVESRKLFNKAGKHPNGNAYGPTRAKHEFYAVAAFNALGMKDVLGEEMGDLALTWIYDRLPTGLLMKDGDSYDWGSHKWFKYQNNGDAFLTMLLGGGLYDNSYVNGEFVKQASMDKYQKEPDWSLLFGDSEKTWEYPDNLPLARKTTYPLTTLTARTSWQNGVDAPTAMVKMKAEERQLDDHMHKDVGSFQLYYKGMLALDSGNYSAGYGVAHDYGYQRRTVAHNALTVYDPNEPTYLMTGNDGGQKARQVTVVNSYEELMSDENKRAETHGIYIGPNENTPEFSYLKTDLSAAYTDKVDNYQRSMVFMDLFDEDYPAAFVVFDHVKSSDKNFKKAWLLHSEQEPTVEGNTTTIVRDTDGFNGKLVNQTMLPQAYAIEKIGGEGHEFEVNGKNYPYKTAAERNGSDSGNWRIEVSPAKANTEDTFLNAMYVTDADGNLPQLPMYQESAGRFVGVTVKDRFVLFDKNGAIKGTQANFTVRNNGYDTVSCLIGDVETGVWKITGGGIEIYAEVKEGENALYFKGAPGSYTISKADGATPTEFTYPQAEKETYGDFLIFHEGDTLFRYAEKPTKLINGVPYVAAETATKFDYLNTLANGGENPGTIASDTPVSVTYNGSGVTITAEGGTAVYTVGSSTYSLNGVEQPMTGAVVQDGETVYIAAEDLKDVTYTGVRYDAVGRILYLSSSGKIKGFQKTYGVTPLQPVAVSAKDNDGNVEANVADWDMSTRWAGEGSGCWLMYDMGAEVNFSKVMIAFNSGDKRQAYFDLQVSGDGRTWNTIYKDGVSSGKTTDLETFDVGNATGRYIRFVGYGNSLNMWNSIFEMVIAQ